MLVQDQGHWQLWLREWQGSLMTLAERNVPSIYSWVEAQVDDLVRANNLTSVGFPATHQRVKFGNLLCCHSTEIGQIPCNAIVQVAQELKVLSVTLQPPKPCTSAERRALVVSRAKAHLHAGKAKARLQRSSQEVPLNCSLLYTTFTTFIRHNMPCTRESRY